MALSNIYKSRIKIHHRNSLTSQGVKLKDGNKGKGKGALLSFQGPIFLKFYTGTGILLREWKRNQKTCDVIRQHDSPLQKRNDRSYGGIVMLRGMSLLDARTDRMYSIPSFPGEFSITIKFWNSNCAIKIFVQLTF